MRFEYLQQLLVLVHVSPQLHYLVAQAIFGIFHEPTLRLNIIGILLLLFRFTLIFLDELYELDAVLMQIILRIFESFRGFLLLLLQLSNLLDDGLVSQFDEEHILLLIDELMHILRPLLLGVLDARSRVSQRILDILLDFT